MSQDRYIGGRGVDTDIQEFPVLDFVLTVNNIRPSGSLYVGYDYPHYLCEEL